MLNDLLAKKLTKNELKLVPRSFDIIGSKEKAIAVIEIDPKLRKKERIIARALAALHKNVRTVLKKSSPRRGKYRIMRTKLIYGSKNTLVVHKESGCLLKLDPRKVYFSPREGTERMRIAEKVKPGETVMIFFAGAGPFAVVIGKKARPKKIIGIEINPAGIKYFRENVKLNKLSDVEIVKGDVKKIAKKYYGCCDRVLMPLPEKAIDYVDDAIKCLRPNGICHLYCFSSEDTTAVKKKIQRASESMGRKVKFLESQKVLPWGPGIWKMRIDFE
ncbi:MAG: class I SAM-dependent methyltransferase family protein [Candidatus Aenigmarchaeota archaeon]|nr:class I SAM-dependent methyltransferase family protein [Candidatus Aenigmarchaeota archaeon]